MTGEPHWPLPYTLTLTDLERLIVASEYDPWSILERLFPYLAGSASIVIQSPNAQVLSVGISQKTTN